MDASSTYQPGRALLAFGLALRVATIVLIVITALAIPLLALNVAGRGGVTVSAVLDDPFRLEFEDGRAVGVDATGSIRTYENFPAGDEKAVLGGELAVTGPVEVDRSDRDARGVVVGMAVAWLVAAWVGLWSLRRIVAVAVAGSPFAPGNPRLLRRVGWAIVAVPVVDIVGSWLLRRSVDLDIGFDPNIGGAPAWLLLAIGVGVLALAEIFAEAGRLQEFEQATI
jgi:hypothetical protein